MLAGAAVRETVWTQSRPPGGPFDRIGPHRYRTHSVPADAAADTLGALRHWTSAVFVDDIASALDCVRATSGRDKVHVAGFSGGAFLAYALASVRPEHLEGLIAHRVVPGASRGLRHSEWVI